MNITDIKIRKLMREGRLRAVVSVTLDNELAIHDIKVIEGPDRLFVAMPSRKETNGASPRPPACPLNRRCWTPTGGSLPPGARRKPPIPLLPPARPSSRPPASFPNTTDRPMQREFPSVFLLQAEQRKRRMHISDC